MHRSCAPALVFLASLIHVAANGAPITLSGTVEYYGPYNGDSLYVAVIDTAGPDKGLYSVLAFDVGNSPLAQPYAFNLDSASAPPRIWIAALLDVDGGGVDSVGALDVVGWYGSFPVPVELSTDSPQSGLDFTLPTAEIHGEVTFVAGQSGAEIQATPHDDCGLQRLSRPSVELSGSGPYSLIGLYAGTYCVRADGWGSGPVPDTVCYGDFSCANSWLITLADGQVVTQVDLSFLDPAPVERSTWGLLKSRYP